MAIRAIFDKLALRPPSLPEKPLLGMEAAEAASLRPR
jgi:hypothetical protein